MANAEYLIRVYDPRTGLLQAVIDDWRTLNYTKKLNDTGDLTLGLDYRDGHLPAVLVTDAIMEVWRRNQPAHLDWYVDDVYLARTPQYEETERGNDIYTVYARSLHDLLSRRSIQYFSSTVDIAHDLSHLYTSKLGPADDVMRAYVRENFTALANNIYRVRPGLMANFSVGIDTSQAPLWRGTRSFQPVLKVLQEIATSHNLDFKVLWTNRHPVEFTFVVYYPVSGNDYSIGNAHQLSPVIMSDRFASLAKSSYTFSRTDEANTIIILGPQGDGGKAGYVYQSLAATDSPWNDIELSQEGRDIPAGLTSAQEREQADMIGAKVLVEQAAKESFIFTAMQSAQFVYGRDYNLGDTCTVEYKAIRRSKRLIRTSVSVSEGDEKLDLEFGDYVPSPTSQYDVLKLLAWSIQQIGITQYEIQFGNVGG